MYAPSPLHRATIHTTHSTGEQSIWFPHARMCRRRSCALSLNRNGEGHLLSEKTQAVFSNTGNLPPAPAAPGGGAKPALGALCDQSVRSCCVCASALRRPCWTSGTPDKRAPMAVKMQSSMHVANAVSAAREPRASSPAAAVILLSNYAVIHA